MGVHKRLTEMQVRFAKELVYHEGKKHDYQCAVAAGYSKNRARQTAAELKNPKKRPLVVNYIEELRNEKREIAITKFKGVADNLASLLGDATEKLREDVNKGKYKKVASTIKSFKPVFKILEEGKIKVYLAEEARPYNTNHYKIGKTGKSIEERKNFTDNPFGINYICFIEYDSSSGFNLEKTLHKFFRFYSTKNVKYNGSSEWFLIKNKNRLIYTFEKVGLSLLRKNKCVGFFKMNDAISGDITSPKM